MVETISQRVNALFGAYMDTEREQVLASAAGDTEIDAALAAKALALHDEVLAISDRTGCADLIGARILLNLIMRHYWHGPDAPQFDVEDRAVALPMLEILSGSLTGAVRREARKALATIGVEIPDADPFVARMEVYRAEVVAFDAALTNGVDPGDPSDPFGAELSSGALAIGSIAGVAEVLRHVLTNESIVDTFDIQLVEAACAFLEGRV